MADRSTSDARLEIAHVLFIDIVGYSNRLTNEQTMLVNLFRALTLAKLRLTWEWDSLRNDPRCRRILAGPEPKTIYD